MRTTLTLLTEPSDTRSANALSAKSRARHDVELVRRRIGDGEHGGIRRAETAVIWRA
jgi:hypothetical protein